MEGDFGSWLQHHHSDWQSPNLNSLTAPLDLGQQHSVPAYTNVSTNGNFPAFLFSGLSHSKTSQPNEPHGWLYCLPHFCQAFAPVQNSIFKEKITPDPYESRRDAVMPNTGSGCAQKRYLVFDQSGDQTTLIFIPRIGTPVQCFRSWTPRLPGAYAFLNREGSGTKRDALHNSGPILRQEHNDNRGDDVRSEMHEDTEELNALLYSDDDYHSSEDDEETSTGHSPSTMTAYDKQEWSEGSAEQVASSAEPTKRQKLCNGYGVPSLMDTATSMPNRCFEFEDDAESSCANGKNQGWGEFDSTSSNERWRKQKVRETVSALQSIIPDGKGKDAIVILDEAIHYLRSLKRKAEELGLHII